MKGISTGGLPFAELRERDKYYVDKTLLIKDLLDADDRGVYLFTRPRRFGKTTNLSMLDAFFNMEYKGKTWFDGLEISRYGRYDSYKHAFPVVLLNLGNTKAESYGSFLNKMQKAVRDAFEPHRYLLEWSDLGKPVQGLFQTLDEKSTGEDELIGSIRLLSASLHSFHGRKTMILIDEYDRAVSDSFDGPAYGPVPDLLRRLLHESIEENDDREMVYITGVMQIAQQSMFPDSNGLIVNNVFSRMSDERFGFTENEVMDILRSFGGEDRFDEAKRRYGGYVFGNAEVYSPYSMMRYVSNGFVPAPYWKNSGSNVVFMRLLESVNDDNMSEITRLLTGGTIRKKLPQSLTHGTATVGNKALYSLMAMAGYLRTVPVNDEPNRRSAISMSGDRFEISIPNEEVGMAVDDIVETVAPIDTGYFSEFIRAMLRGDTESMERRFEDVLSHGNYPNLKENAYEVVMMTLVRSLVGRYHIETEHESAFGRTDIVLRPEDETVPPMVFELKTSKRYEDLGADAEDAIVQIHEKQYYRGMPGDVRIYGISFYSNTLKVLTETIHNDSRGIPVDG